jgi:hypothetical protein
MLIATFMKRKTRSSRGLAAHLDGAEAFVPDFRSGFFAIGDGDVEALGEEFVLGATSNDAVGELARDEVHPAELYGFVFDLEDTELFDIADLGRPDAAV